jgi:prophage regulatory protein
MNASTSLRPKAAAQYLSISTATLWRWTKRPDFPKPIKIGPQTTVFRLDQLAAWRDAQQATVSPGQAGSWDDMVASGAVRPWPLSDGEVPSSVVGPRARRVWPMVPLEADGAE